jgi:hypothetical protein
MKPWEEVPMVFLFFEGCLWYGSFVVAQDLFSTRHILAALQENQLAPLALRHVFRRALRCGGRVPRKNLPIAHNEAAIPKAKVGEWNKE